MTIERLIKRLKKLQPQDSDEFRKMRKDAYYRLQKKVTRINNRNRLRIENWHDYLLSNTSYFFQRCNEDDFTILYRSDFTIENYYREKYGQDNEGFLYSGRSGTPLPCCRRLNTLIFNNPKAGCPASITLSGWRQLGCPVLGRA